MIKFNFYKEDGDWILDLTQNNESTKILMGNVTNEDIISTAIVLGKGDITECSVNFTDKEAFND